MRISSRTKYAATAVLHLAKQYGEGPVSIRKIAGEHGISVKYLEHIMRGLVSAGIAASELGKNGGFFITRAPDAISVYDVFLATEGEPASAFYLPGGGKEKKLDSGSMRGVWLMLGKAISECLKSISFQDMIDEQKQVYNTLRNLKNEFPAGNGGQ